jgi:hypothetical protein
MGRSDQKPILISTYSLALFPGDSLGIESRNIDENIQRVL